MTTIIGLKGKDFIMIAVDSQITSGNLKLPFPYQKIQIVDNNLIAGAGSVGSLQQILDLAIRNIRVSKVFDGSDYPVIELKDLVKELASLNFNLPLEHKNYNSFSYLMAGVKDETPTLYLIGDDGSRIEVPTYLSEGSGSQLAMSIIGCGYKDNLTEQEAYGLMVEALKQSNKHDNYTNNQIQVLELGMNDKNTAWEIKEFRQPTEEELNEEKKAKETKEKIGGSQIK